MIDASLDNRWTVASPIMGTGELRVTGPATRRLMRERAMVLMKGEPRLSNSVLLVVWMNGGN